MCRHLAYVGAPVTLAELVLDPPHSLLHQSWAPADMRGGGTINADGFGLGWHPSPGSDAVRYRRSSAIWTDLSLTHLARAVRSGCVLAAVRSASAGMPVVETAAAPFTYGRWLFSHNGLVAGWPGSVTKLAATIPVEDLVTLDAPTDSALLWALVRHRLRAGASPGEALAGVAADVVRLAPRSRLNLLLTDGEMIAATTWTHALSVRDGPGGVAVSSEPLDLDDTSWRQVPDRCVVEAWPGTVKQYPLDEAAA
ncbi:MAG: ergothioneine biosynthesis protein EgtC [Nocardioidaceae bacterium]|jgi:glutamine amidotransferase|nr:ergothioneine biosynthesis protein EgtC [Nocardioidaceae bacterium]